MKILIVGAGPVGCTVANLFSNKRSNKIEIVEKRNHIAGNCYDYYDVNNILVHKYGPHYFRTNKKYIIEYLSKFTKWIKGEYYVNSYDNRKLYQFPINLNTLEEVYQQKFTKEKAEKYFQDNKKKIKKPKNFEEYLISKIGNDLYSKFYKNYTIKQWGIDPKKLKSDIAMRIPIRTNRNNKYLKEKFQLMPSKGFTFMFGNMIKSKNIKVMLNSKIEINSKTKDWLKKNYDLIIYTGPIDKFFLNKYGKLNWRSLKFNFKNFKQRFKQPVCQINYPNNFRYTRTVEYKHVTKQDSDSTTISYEYPLSKGDPYYPVNTKIDETRYKKYLELADEFNEYNIYFAGRLAQYTYINTDEAINIGLNLYKKLNKLYKE